MSIRTFLAICTSVFVVSCGEQTREKVTNSDDEQVEMMPEKSLQTTLDAHKNRFKRNPDTAKKNAYTRGIKEVAESGIYGRAKNVGDKAPDFILTNAVGRNVRLYDVLNNGPVVLTWYRGGWCPYCNITLATLQARLDDFKAEGATLLALTPEVPDSSISTQEKHELEFQVLSDLNNKVARDYGIVFKLNDKVAEYYNNGFGLSEYNGNTSDELPLAATYVIDKNGIIRYAFLNADYTKRAEPDTIIQELKTLK